MKLPLVLALLAGLLAACSSAPSHYYVLSAQPPAMRPTAEALARTTTVAIGAVRLPGALDRPQIARRIGPNQLDFSETERWAGPLDDMVRRVLSADLRTRLPPGMVMVENDSAAPANLTIAINVSRFDAYKSGRVTLEAGWEMLGKSAAIVAAPSEARIIEPASGSDTAALAATMSRALATLADRIAAGIIAGRASAAH
ncbi:MAG: PqiC family protein [Stellaceae bacterium]